MSLNPSGGGFRFDECRIAGMMCRGVVVVVMNVGRDRLWWWIVCDLSEEPDNAGTWLSQRRHTQLLLTKCSLANGPSGGRSGVAVLDFVAGRSRGAVPEAAFHDLGSKCTSTSRVVFRVPEHCQPTMAITPTQFAKKTAQCESSVSLMPTIMLTCRIAANWSDAKRRVLSSYREWIRAVS